MSFDFLRIDVHSAGDDHEALAIGQIEEAIFINFAHIAQGRPALRIAARRLFLIIPMIFEDIFAFEENRAFFVRTEFGFIILAHAVDRAEDRTADRSEEHTTELQSLMRISYA